MPTKFFALLFFLFLFACQKDSSPTVSENETEIPTFDYLVSATKIKEVSSSSIAVFAGLFLPEDFTPSFNNVTGYQIIYKTPYGDETIEASGLLLVPNTTDALPLISFQHGTLTDLSNTPSAFKLDRNEATIGAIAASIGYVVMLPDYIGYGVSEYLPHPYEVGESLGTVSLDMLRAALEYLETEEINHTDKLFLAGYSEGGYATMALLQQLEQTTSLEVTHASLGAGAYNKTGFSEAIFQKDEPLTFMTTYLWVLHTYNTLYSELNRSWSALVNAPYAAQLEAISDWKTHADWSGLETNPQVLFTADLLAEFNSENSPLKRAIAKNDLHNWAPKTPLTLFHGTADDFVFPLNSETTFEAMRNQGVQIDYISLEGKNHQTAVLPYIEQTLRLFEQLKN
jgi:acetyl esterase/lipase